MSAPLTLHGRLGSEPELRFSPSGTAIAKFTVVTDVRRKDGEKWESTDVTFWNVTAFKNLAENICESLGKGNLVIVVGKVKQRTWETPEGEKRSAFEVTAEHVGPDLIWDSATVNKTQRPTVGATEPDPWANQSEQPAAAPF